ncbi:hypothetical protein [Prosthecobacter sp.]|uniref:hypothetical protein n=1 Tax=Prosthecobacter sp. TaxID=1965333 RepID=UPI0037843D67
MSRASGLKAVAVVLVRLINSPATRSDHPGAVAEIDFLPLKQMDNTQPPALPEAPTQTREAAPSKPPVTKKDEILGCGCLIIVALGVMMLLKSCFFGGDKADAVAEKRTFAMTAEEFRTAFNKEQQRLQIESFKEETIDGEPWVSCVFDDGSDIKINLEPKTKRICTLMCAFTKHPPERSQESYLLANTVIFVLSPEANTGEAWGLVDRLTKEADGSDDVKGSGESLRNLSVSMVSTGKSDSGLPLVMFLFTPRPEEVKQAPAVENNDGGPSDEIIRRFSYAGPRGKFERGETMISTGGRVPAGTLLFPVRSNPDPYGGHYRYFFFRDEFGDWKLMRQEGESKVQIFKPRKSTD